MLPKLWSLVQLKDYTVKNWMEKPLIMYTGSWDDEKLLKALRVEQEKKLDLKSKQQKIRWSELCFCESKWALGVAREAGRCELVLDVRGDAVSSYSLFTWSCHVFWISVQNILGGRRIGMTTYSFASRKLGTVVTIQAGLMFAAWFLLTLGIVQVRSEVLG